MRHILVLFLAFAVTACTLTPQEVSLSPSLTVAKTDIGQGHELAVKVVDKRYSKLIGRRGIGFKGAKITTEQDVTLVFSEAFYTAFQDMGFKIVEYNKSHPNALIIEIHALNYGTSLGLWTDEIYTEAAARIISPAIGSSSGKLYVSEIKERVFWLPNAKKNERLLNEAMSGLVEKIASDRELISTFGT